MATDADADVEPILAVLHDAADAVVIALADHGDWGPSGVRAGQYASDVVADRAAVAVLDRAGFRILSEESGLSDGSGPTVVIDPLDGSTNASRHLPWYATSLCAVDDGVPAAAVVHDLVSGVRYDAARGRGARRDGEPLEARPTVPLNQAIVAVNDIPPGHGGWAQFRAFGAIALDLCAVADGRLDGYVDFAPDSHGVWDYLGATLVCLEAGVTVVDALGRDLVVVDPAARRMPLAAREPLLTELVEMRSRLVDGPEV